MYRIRQQHQPGVYRTAHRTTKGIPCTVKAWRHRHQNHAPQCQPESGPQMALSNGTGGFSHTAPAPNGCVMCSSWWWWCGAFLFLCFGGGVSIYITINIPAKHARTQTEIGAVCTISRCGALTRTALYCSQHPCDELCHVAYQALFQLHVSNSVLFTNQVSESNHSNVSERPCSARCSVTRKLKNGW